LFKFLCFCFSEFTHDESNLAGRPSHFPLCCAESSAASGGGLTYRSMVEETVMIVEVRLRGSETVSKMRPPGTHYRALVAKIWIAVT